MLAAFAVFLFGFATASCSVPSATVYFSADGQIVAEAEVTETSGLELFEPETDDGRYFVGWYADEAFTEPFDYHRYIVNDFPEDVVIYALFVDGDPDVCAHELRHFEGKAPSCVEAGSAEYWHCALCGKNFATEDCLTEIDTVILAPTGHDLVFVPEKDASCTEGGNAQHWFCPSCGKYFLDEDATTETDDPGIPALSHLPVYVAEVSPACDEEGTAEHWKCARCALTFSDASCMTPVKDGDLVIPAPGHSFGERTISSAPDETSAGKVVSVCSACGDARTETVPALSDRDFYSVSETPSSCSEHGYRIYSFVLDGEALYVREPLPLADHVPAAPSGAFDNSCTENGYTGDVLCEVCGAMLSEGVTVPAKGHSYDDGVVTVKPSCGHKGECVFTCSECGNTDVRELAPLPHSLEYFSELLPTCTQDGVETRICSVCNATETRALTATGHDYTAVITAPTCTEQGYTTHTCSICGDSYTDEYKAALGHSYTAVVTAPTCTKDGFTTHTCTTCGDSYIDSIVPAMGHTADEWVVTKEPTHTETGLRTQSCKICGEVLATEEIDVLTGLVGDVNEDGVVNAIDARWTLQTVADLRALRYSTLADVDGDGKVSVVDARWILQAVAGLRTL